MTYPHSYAFRLNNDTNRLISQSGGAFKCFADQMLSHGGVVYGVILDDNLDAIFSRATNAGELRLMHKSKYVQARVEDAFKDVRKDLSDGIPVLFSGTSCQVAGLRAFLCDVDQSNLLCVDIVCHGVPSPRVYRDYISWNEKKVGSRCIGFNFRNKGKFGWHSHVETLSFENGASVDSPTYATLFYQHNTLRPSCFVCPYKSISRVADLSIADYWGIERVAPDLDDNKGVSLVIVSTEKGQKMLDRIGSTATLVATDLDKSLQPPLIAPFDRPPKRAIFWRDYERHDFDFIYRKYVHRSLPRRCFSFAKRVVRKVLVQHK